MKFDLEMEREGSKKRYLETVTGSRSILPVTEIIGTKAGPSVLITSGIHGGEYPGMAASMEIAAMLTPEDVSGKLTFIHSANPCAFWGRRPEINDEDKKNLNRVFPGDPNGTPTDRLAAVLMERYIRRSDFYVDLHSGDIHEELCPHVYYSKACTREVSKLSKRMALHVDVPYMVPSLASGGAYNCAALNGVPSILIERGGNGLCRTKDVEGFKRDMIRLLTHLSVLATDRFEVTALHESVEEIKKVIYVLGKGDGCWRTELHESDRVKKGNVLGYTTNLFGDRMETYLAEEDGVVLYINTSLALLNGKVAVAYAVV